MEKSPSRAGRPTVALEVRGLIRKMSLANPLWGAPRVHGELLKLGIEVSPARVAKYMARRQKPPSQTWRTFLNNHVKELVSTERRLTAMEPDAQYLKGTRDRYLSLDRVFSRDSR